MAINTYTTYKIEDGFIAGGHIAPTTTTLAAETVSMVVAVAGIALGLTKEETEVLGYKAYSVCRGKGPADMYEALITLAYEIIKSRRTDG